MTENIDNDFLEIYLITSQAAGFEPSCGRPFGVGKSTLSIWMAYRAYAYERGLLDFIWRENADGKPVLVIADLAAREQQIDLMAHVVENYVKWDLKLLVDLLKSCNSPLPAVVWDDVQRTAPAYQHVPKELRDLIEYLTMARQKVRNIIMTAPAMSDIAKPLRRNITWEIIVPQRGVYEVQFLAKHRDFYNPSDDKSRLWYEASGTFDPLPKEIDELYKKLREEQISV